MADTLVVSPTTETTSAAPDPAPKPTLTPACAAPSRCWSCVVVALLALLVVELVLVVRPTAVPSR